MPQSPPPATSPTTASWQSRVLTFLRTRNGAIAAVAVVAVLVILGSLSLGGGSHTIKGSITLTAALGDGPSIALDDYENAEEGDPCSGLGGYDDMDTGTNVTVRDEDGTLLATGSLEAGILSEVLNDVFFACEFSFKVEDVPDAKFYSVEASRRGGLDTQRPRWKRWTGPSVLASAVDPELLKEAIVSS